MCKSINRCVENFLKFIGVVILGKLVLDALKKYRCPRCNYPVSKKQYSCPNCGQPLEWESDNNLIVVKLQKQK